jgi:alpha-tubulin suppressor-like RCC1 family protein
VIKSDGIAWCVGRNSWSELTHDSGTTDVVTPAVQFDAESAGAIAPGSNFVCFVSCTTGATRCAGKGTSGQLGDGNTATSDTLVIATGPDSVCEIIK